MRRVSRVDFQNNLVIIRYNDDTDPRWVQEQVLVVNWRQSTNIDRLAHVGYHVFHLLVEHPEQTTVSDEVLQEWVGRLFSEEPDKEHEIP